MSDADTIEKINTAEDLYNSLLDKCTLKSNPPTYAEFMIAAFKEKDEKLVKAMLNQGESFTSKDDIVNMLQKNYFAKDTASIKRQARAITKGLDKTVAPEASKSVADPQKKPSLKL